MPARNQRAPFEFKTEKLTFDDDEPFELHARVNNQPFIIQLLDDAGATSDESETAQFLRKIREAEESDDGGELFLVLGEVEEYVKQHSLPFLHDLAPAWRKSEKTLQSCLNPAPTVLQVITTRGKTEVRPGNPLHPQHISGMSLEAIVLLELPRFRPSELTVLEKLRSLRVTLITVNGQSYCCKIIQPYYPDIIRELEVMQDIHNATDVLKVPRLQGFVISEAGDQLIGFLMDYVVSNPDLSNLGSIHSSVDAIDLNRREKWANQVGVNLRILHNMGRFWGDVKADNFLIDANDNAWLIDMGGSRTEGWVSEELQDSIDGDLEGYHQICRYLKVEPQGSQGSRIDLLGL